MKFSCLIPQPISHPTTFSTLSPTPRPHACFALTFGPNVNSEHSHKFAWLFTTTHSLGKWIQSQPSGCATKCGVAAGKSGTPGAVTCSTTSCDLNTKPAAKQCPKTVDCGTFGTDMPIVNRHCHHDLAFSLHIS